MTKLERCLKSVPLLRFYPGMSSTFETEPIDQINV